MLIFLPMQFFVHIKVFIYAMFSLIKCSTLIYSQSLVFICGCSATNVYSKIYAILNINLFLVPGVLTCVCLKTRKTKCHNELFNELFSSLFSLVAVIRLFSNKHTKHINISKIVNIDSLFKF